MAGRSVVSAPSANQPWKPSPRIIFDVGGQKFATSVDTLNRFPGSVLEKIVNGHFESVAESDGSYFIDRSPTYFPLILSYMRYSDSHLEVESALSEMSMAQRSVFLEESIFYELSGLESLVRSRLSNLLTIQDWEYFRLAHLNGLVPVNRFDVPSGVPGIASSRTEGECRVIAAHTQLGLLVVIGYGPCPHVWTLSDQKESQWVQQSSSDTMLITDSMHHDWFASKPSDERLSFASGVYLPLPIGLDPKGAVLQFKQTKTPLLALERYATLISTFHAF